MSENRVSTGIIVLGVMLLFICATLPKYHPRTISKEEYQALKCVSQELEIYKDMNMRIEVKLRAYEYANK